MKFNKKLERFDTYENNKKFPIYDIQDSEGTYLTFKIDCHWWEIEEMQKKGLVFDHYEEEEKLFYFKCAYGINRGIVHILQEC